MAKPLSQRTEPHVLGRATSKAVGPREVPFGIKVKAWWGGYDAVKLQAYLLGRMNSTEASHSPTVADAEQPIVCPDPWSKARLEVAQLIWGREYCGPGGPDQVIAMSKLLTLTPEMSMMDLAAGIGGPARVLAEYYGVWVSGYETSQACVDAGNALSLMAGKAKKAPLMKLDVHAEKPFDRRFDRALANGFLSRIEDKPKILRKIIDTLKPEGMIFICDFFARDNHVLSHPDLPLWLAKETEPLYFSTIDLVKTELEALGMQVRVNAVITDEYSEQVNNAWRNADRLVAKLMADPKLASLAGLLLEEAELWAKRIELLKSNQLDIRRLLAVKTDRKG